MIVNKIDVIYVNLCLMECFNIVLICMIEFCSFGIEWGRMVEKSCFHGSGQSDLASVRISLLSRLLFLLSKRERVSL